MTNSPKTTDRFPAQSRKRQIIETVLELVAAHGTEAVSFQLVADRIGVTQPAVFRHFPTKEVLWLAVMDWLEQRLVGIYSSEDEADEAALVVVSGMFLEHMQLIERYPALAKLVFSDHLRLQFPSLQARFGEIHRAYMARLSALLSRAGSDGSVPPSLNPKDGATMFLSLVQGLGFQFAIAGLQIRFQPEAERLLALYLQGIMYEKSAADRVSGMIEAAKRRRKGSGLDVEGKRGASVRASKRRR
jgi:AcrR family transcriptional regulator